MTPASSPIFKVLASFLLVTYNTQDRLRKERRVQIPRLREWREARALTQEELAGRAGVSVRSVAGYEAGAGARPGTVRKLAGALDVEVANLLGALPKEEAPSSPRLAKEGEGRRDLNIAKVAAKLQSVNPTDRRIMAYVTHPQRVLVLLDEVMKGTIATDEAKWRVTQILKDLGLLGLYFDEVYEAITLHDAPLKKRVEDDVKDKQETLLRHATGKRVAESDTA